MDEDRFEEAIQFARIGIQLKQQSSADVNEDIEHPLALALRDSRVEANLNEAWIIVLEGHSLEELLREAQSDKKGMAYYGNVGRCLQLLNRFDDAMHCYKKSLLEAALKSDFVTLKNTAYAFWWIGEIFIEKKNPLVAWHFSGMPKIFERK